MFIIGFILSIFAVIASLFLWLYLKDSGCLSLLGILAITIPLTASGRKIFSIKAKSEIRENLLNDYRNKLKN